MNDWDARDCVIEEIRHLMNAGYRRKDIPQVEAGIDKLWHLTDWWTEAVNRRMDFVIEDLIAA